MLCKSEEHPDLVEDALHVGKEARKRGLEPDPDTALLVTIVSAHASAY